jgi:hypothetical protein
LDKELKISEKQFHIIRGAVISLAFRATLILVAIATGLLGPKALVSAQTVAGAGYYASPNGNDANPGTLSQPWKTLAFAAQKLHAGDTLYIRGGTYQEHFSISNSGTQLSPILVTNYNNEEVIIDGVNNTLPRPESGTPLIGVYGNWVIISNLTIQYSGALGAYGGGAHVTFDNLYVHHNRAGGVILSGNYDLIQNSRIWYNSTINENNQSTSGWGTGVSCARYPDYCTIRSTIAWENWGEGISTYEALHTTIENNISYNNQQNFYISDTKYTIMQRNLSYCTPGNPIDPYSTQNGILVGDEKGVPIPLDSNGTRYPSSDNIFVNNLVTGCNHNLAVGTNESNNNLYAYNTFVNSAGSTAEQFNILFYSGTATNARFLNNIVVQDDSRSVARVVGLGIIFSNNLWSKAPPSNATGAGDVIGDPKLAKTGQPYSAEWFELTVFSPAIDKAISIKDVFVDFFGYLRETPSDIGAIEYNPYAQP